MWWLSYVCLHLHTILVVALFSTRSYGIKWPTNINVTVTEFDGVFESEIDNSTSWMGVKNGVNWTQIYSRGSISIGKRNADHEQQLRDESIGYDSRIGLFLFTRYCGPGSRIWQRIFPNGQRSYSDIDLCCKMHDGCPNFVEKREHYNQYPGLEIRPQYFSRLQCKCDSDFYKCLGDLKSPYASTVAIGYSVFQRNCLELEHPIEGCLQYYSSFGMKRCEIYQVNYQLPKVWQWFDVLPPYSNYTEFPQIAQPNTVL